MDDSVVAVIFPAQGLTFLKTKTPAHVALVAGSEITKLMLAMGEQRQEKK